MESHIANILKENERRYADKHKPFNPMVGDETEKGRVKLEIPDFPIHTQYVPKQMLKEPIVKAILKEGSISNYIKKNGLSHNASEELITKILLKLRSKYDFPFFAYMFCKIKNKRGGKDIRFKLNRPQRILLKTLEEQRTSNKPIRVILLKARQFGGSTLVQIYYVWIQLLHKSSWNSIIASHTNTVSATVRGMVTKLMQEMPSWILYPIGEPHDEREPKMTSFEGQQSIQYLPSRNTKIRIATSNAPDNLRSEDASLVHMTECSLWAETKILHVADYVDAICSGILYAPYTAKVMESTAKGSTNYFAQEYRDAKLGIGEYTPVFIPWREIENDEIEFDSEKEKKEFAQWLYDNRFQKEATDRRSEPGSYLWRQWEKGATLEGLKWYVHERRSKSSRDHMASEAPSDDVEAFSATGEDLFDRDVVEQLRAGCKLPKFIGEIQGAGNKGTAVLNNVKFIEDKSGELSIWQLPEHFEGERCKNRYLVIVDIGGTSYNADWSVICVIDRYWMMEGGRPSVVAQWYGHIDHDILAWKATQIAKYYDDALLVIESNTYDKERDVNADVSEFILNRVKSVYSNLYEREANEEDIKAGIPVRYGFHTNKVTKPKIIKGLQECVRDAMYVERDERCLDEMLTYEHNGNKYEAKQGYHDDLLMTRAIGLWVCFNEMPEPEMVPIKPDEESHYNTQIGLM